MAESLEDDASHFLSLLASQLNEPLGEDLKRESQDIVENKLRELLIDSLEALPECPLKNHLQENIPSHCQSLMKYLNNEGASDNCLSVQFEVNNKRWAFVPFSLDKVESALLNIDVECQNKTKHTNRASVLNLYQELLVTSVWNNGMGLSLILKHWSEYLITFCTCYEILAAIKFLLTCFIKDHTLITCMDFFVRLFTFLFENSPPTSLIDVLFSLLVSAHFTYQSIKDPLSCDLKHCYDDHLSSLLSVYIRLYSLVQKKRSVHSLTNLLNTVAGKEACLRSLVLAGKNSADDVILTLIKSVIKNISLLASTNASLYISCLCGVHLLMEQTDHDKTLIMNQFDKIIVPSTLGQHLNDLSPNAYQLLGLNEKWPPHKIHKHLISNLSSAQKEFLFKLVYGSRLPSTGSEKQPDVITTHEEDVDRSEVASLYYVDKDGDLENMNMDSPQNREEIFSDRHLDEPQTEDTILMETDAKMEDNSKLNKDVLSDLEEDTCVTTDLLPSVSAAIPKTKSTPNKKRIRLKNLRRNLTPPKNKSHLKFSPKFLRSTTRKLSANNK